MVKNKKRNDKKEFKISKEYVPNVKNVDITSMPAVSSGLDAQFPADMSEDAKKKLTELKDKLDGFQKKVLDKFSDYVLGISLLPPPKPEVDPETGKEQPIDKNKIYLLVLVDDSDSKKMSKEELKEKLSTIIHTMAEEVDKRLAIETLLLTELWQ
jgi:hypothetical protein